MKDINYTSTWDLDHLLNKAACDLRLPRDAKVLNIACENDRVPSSLKGLIENENIFGVDLNADATDPQIKKCDVDLEPLPFASNSLDLVISVWGLEHFASDNICQEAARVLKPGGTFLFVTPNIVNPIFLINRLFGNRFARWYYKKIMRSPYDPHQVNYRLNSVRAILRAAGVARYKKVTLTLAGPGHLKFYFRNHLIARIFLSAVDIISSTPITYQAKPYILGRLIAT